MTLAELAAYFRRPPVLFEVVDVGTALAHAQYKIAWYRYVLLRARDYEPPSAGRYIKELCIRKIEKWRAIERALLDQAPRSF